MGCQNLREKHQETKVPVEESQTTTEVPTVPQQPTLQQKPEFLGKKNRNIGLILGPGGALAYAHIGFLQELEAQKIPVRALVGVEWGSLVAATYAQNGKAHAAEWKLLKLPVDIFSSKGFFSKKTAPSAVALEPFLKETLNQQSFENLSPPFACPSLSLSSSQIRLQQTGPLIPALKDCVSYPPHFNIQNQAAHPLAIEEAAQFLRSQDVDIVVYLDVISPNKIFSSGQDLSNAERLLWAQVQSKSLRGSWVGVDEVIRIPLSGHNMQSYQSLRAIVRTGQIKSQQAVKGLAKKYGY